jgi:phosphoribosylglycinamide formyltransferase-1
LNINKKKIAIFASGSGSNAEEIINYFKNDPEITVSLILTNNPKAGVIEKADKAGVIIKIFSRKAFYETSEIVDLLKEANIDLIVLAGFLWLLPQNLIQDFPNRIINIHPALLPKYGGKGMYGMNVHKAIIEAKEKESGITIHYINEKYDEGEIILQKKCLIADEDTAEDLVKKIQQLEHEYFPKVIEDILKIKYD